MANTQFVEIIVYCTDEDFKYYINLDGYSRIKIAGKCHTLMEFKSYVLMNKKAVIVIDEDATTEMNRREILEFMLGRENRFVFCTSSMLNSSLLMNYPKGEIFIKRDISIDSRRFIWNIAEKIEKIVDKVIQPESTIVKNNFTSAQSQNEQKFATPVASISKPSPYVPRSVTAPVVSNANEIIINIVVYCRQSEFQYYINLDGYGNVKILFACHSLPELKSKINNCRESIIIVDEDVIISKEKSEALQMISEKSLKFIFCSKSIISAFFVKKYQKSEIYLKGDYDKDNRKFIWGLSDKINKISKTVFVVADKAPADLQYKKYNNIIGIGSSTGGTELVFQILKELPADLNVPILVVQHMPAVFTQMYSERMNKSCDITVEEAVDGTLIVGRHAYIAPGGKQLVVEKKGTDLYIKIKEFDPERVNNPSVDELFYSLATNCREKVIGIILTGMGKDGADGLLKIRLAGGSTIGQDQETSVVYGMPKVAFDIGAVMKQLPINEISGQVKKFIKN